MEKGTHKRCGVLATTDVKQGDRMRRLTETNGIHGIERSAMLLKKIKQRRLCTY